MFSRSQVTNFGNMCGVTNVVLCINLKFEAAKKKIHLKHHDTNGEKYNIQSVKAVLSLTSFSVYLNGIKCGVS